MENKTLQMTRLRAAVVDHAPASAALRAFGYRGRGVSTVGTADVTPFTATPATELLPTTSVIVLDAPLGIRTWSPPV